MKRRILDEAYRKLKGSIYMDKTAPYLRADIAKFENEDFENRMETILEAINCKEKWADFEDRILDSIRVFTVPKRLIDDDSKEEEITVVSNLCPIGACIKEYDNFIDISVEGHIIGILWILLVGYKIDNKLYENCFGKRLCEKVVFDDTISESPNLFKLYFEQYEKWRNKGLEEAEKIVNNEKRSVIITMLDLSRYYYNIDFTAERFNYLVGLKYESEEKNRLSILIYKIMRRYSELLGEKNKTMLPIGYLPSNILSNAYLREFDFKASKDENTVYYGRYVDDMMFVTIVDGRKRLGNSVLRKGKNEVAAYMMNRFVEQNLITVNGEDNISIIGYENLTFKKQKFRFFYIDKNGYNAIIEKIKDDISQNTSEFNYIPDETDFDLGGDILRFKREDTVNKLRSVSEVTVDKYTLSKAIGKNIKMARYSEKHVISQFIRSIELILNSQEIIKNYTLWESVIEYYTINQKIDKIKDFTTKVFSAIVEMDEYSSKIGDFEYLNSEKIHTVGDTLLRFYVAGLTRSLAIIWGKKVKDVLKEIATFFDGIDNYKVFKDEYQAEQLIKMRKYYCCSRMINHYLLQLPLDDYLSIFSLKDNSERIACFNLLDGYLDEKKCKKMIINDAKYSPIISKPFDILYSLLLNKIKNSAVDLYDDEKCVDWVCRRYAENFNGAKIDYLGEMLDVNKVNNTDDIIIKVETKAKSDNESEYLIAIANVEMNPKDFKDILNGNKRNISKRCAEIVRIVNEAIRYKSDILVFPEAYIPISFLPVIQAKAAEHNMTIIGGIEHIKQGNLIYNLTVTLVPTVSNKARYTLPFFHAKVFYSPSEEKDIRDKKLIPVMGKGHTLFNWKGISFVTFCCFEITSLETRAKFKREADVVFAVEWNKDTYYFSNIIESLSRDRCCFCAQSNMSVYGDSRIVQPKSSVFMNIARVKGGINGTVLIDKIDIGGLRNHKSNPKTIKKSSNSSGDEKAFKPLPAGY